MSNSTLPLFLTALARLFLLCTTARSWRCEYEAQTGIAWANIGIVPCLGVFFPRHFAKDAPPSSHPCHAARRRSCNASAQSHMCNYANHFRLLLVHLLFAIESDVSRPLGSSARSGSSVSSSSWSAALMATSVRFMPVVSLPALALDRPPLSGMLIDFAHAIALLTYRQPRLHCRDCACLNSWFVHMLLHWCCVPRNRSGLLHQLWRIDSYFEY